MAATGILPQRYVNGVPVPTSRKTLRMREKYVILLVFVTFGTVCFGAFMYLPDMRDRVRVDSLIVPQRGNRGRIIGRHGDSGVDVHVVDDKERLNQKIEFDMAQQKRMEEVGMKNNMLKEEVLKVKENIEEDKDKIIRQKQKEEEQQKQLEMEKLKEIKQEHGGGEGAQGGEPSDSRVKEQREKVKEVKLLLCNPKKVNLNLTCVMERFGAM